MSRSAIVFHPSTRLTTRCLLRRSIINLRGFCLEATKAGQG